MKKTWGSVISKVLAVAFIAVGFMIIRPSAAYALTCTGITIDGPNEIARGGQAVFYTVTLTFDANVTAENAPQNDINNNFGELSLGEYPSNDYSGNTWTRIYPLMCNTNVNDNTTTFTVSCGAQQGSKNISIFTPPEYSITVHKSGGGNSTASASATSAVQGTTINLTATPAEGYSFVNWTSEDTDINNESSATGASFNMPSTAVTVTANFSGSGPAPTVYNVTVTTDGHGEAYANKRSGVSGTKVMLKEVPDDGYRFKQWEVVSGGVELDNYRDYTTSFEIKNANVEIKAHFEKKEDDYGPEESKSEAAWTPEKAAATIAAEKAAKQQAAGTQMAAVQTLLRTLATKKPGGPGETPTVINLDMTKVDILDPATVNLLTLNSKFEYNIKIPVVGGLTTTVKIPANFNFRTFIKSDGTMNIHEVLWSIVKSRGKKATPNK